MIPNALMKRIPFRRGAFPPVPPLLHFLITAALLIFIALGWSSSVTDMLGASASCSPSRVDGDTLFLQGVDPAAFYLRRPPPLLSRRVVRLHNRLLSKQLVRCRSSRSRSAMNLSILRSLLLMAGVDVASPSVNLLLRLVSQGRVSDRSLAVIRKKVAYRLRCCGQDSNHAPAASRFFPKGAPLARNLIKILLIIAGVEQNPGPDVPMTQAAVCRRLKNMGQGIRIYLTYRFQGGERATSECVIGPFDINGVYQLGTDAGVVVLCPVAGWEYYDIRVVVAGETDSARASSLDRLTNGADDDNSGDAGLVEVGSSPSPQRTHIIANDSDTALVNNGPMRDWLQQPPNAAPHTPAPSQVLLSQSGAQQPLQPVPVVPIAPVHLASLEAMPDIPLDERLRSQMYNLEFNPSTVHRATFASFPFPKATEPADLASFEVNVPSVSILPHRLKANWAESISGLVKDYSKGNAPARDNVMRALIRAPEILLAQTKQRMGDRTIANLTAEEVTSAPSPPKRPLKSKSPEERVLNRCKTLAIAGFCSNAVKVLMRGDPVAISEEAKVAALRALHPKRVEDIAGCALEAPIELKLPKKKNRQEETPQRKSPKKPVVEPPLKTYARRLAKGKSSGVSGWTEELICEAITSASQKEWLAIFEDIVSAKFTPDTTRLLRQSILIGIPKGDDGVRPLALGEALVKVGVKLLLENDRQLKDDSAVGGFQYAFKDFGVEQIIHKVRHHIRSDASCHVILVDCRNAFNSIRRQSIRDVLMSNSRFNSLRALFNAFYVEQGDLIVRGESEKHPVISSSEGVRQGDVLGPLLFCLALKPAVCRALEKFQQLFPGKTISVYAYMDDITIIGSESAGYEFFVLLEHELEGIGLSVNREKTVMTSSIFAGEVKCKVQSCFKLLGAYVSRNPSEEKAEIDKLPEKHEVLFNRLPLLPAEVAFRLLILCGVPRWAHLIRTHEPNVSRPASVAFTEMSTRCLSAILHADYDNLDDQTFRQMRIPIRHGGLGLHDWSEKAEEAYSMSVNMESNRATSEDADSNMLALQHMLSLQQPAPDDVWRVPQGGTQTDPRTAGIQVQW